MHTHTLHTHPSDAEKHSYTRHHLTAIVLLSFLSFVGVSVSSYRFFGVEPVLHIFYVYWGLTLLYFLVSIIPNQYYALRPFNKKAHQSLIRAWHPREYPSVDVFLPTCGEDCMVLRNTWDGVRAMAAHYPGAVHVYSLDDAAHKDVEALAHEYGFTYLVREDRGHFKKAGNLRHGFRNSHSEFICIFDADFRPRPDYLHELLPYFDAYPRLGIVQSPQYFDTHAQQHWIERGAGAVQEYFYRSIQQNRQAHEGAICVGTCAVYRRAALDAIGGTALIEHSEDVHTGFDVMRNGWALRYVPIVLAKGICPHTLEGFFKQQYRWCLGSMSLLSSEKFWNTAMPFRRRLCFISGFLYYIHTGISVFIVPLIPLALIFIAPEQAKIGNYILLVPSFIYAFVVFPLWHTSRYDASVALVRYVYGVAHCIAIVGALTRQHMGWHATGVAARTRSTQYTWFGIILHFFSFPVALLWVGGSLWRMYTWSTLDFLPAFLLGVLFLVTVSRILLEWYRDVPERTYVLPA